MNLMSSSNSFYRYEVNTHRDIEDSTFARRKDKKIQNCKKNFFFCIIHYDNNAESILTFLNKYYQPNDKLMLNVDFYLKYIEIFYKYSPLLYIENTQHIELLKKNTALESYELLFCPITTKDLECMFQYATLANKHNNIYWQFRPYNKNILHSVSIANIVKYKYDFKNLPNLEIYNFNAPLNFELQPSESSSLYDISWSTNSPNAKPVISIIIPSYNNALFLSNVIWHLHKQNVAKDMYEVIVVDDGSLDNSKDITKDLFAKLDEKINLKFIYWHKSHPTKGDQSFFRSGLARNLATHYSSGEYLLFLDSDMLVPPHFVETALNEMKHNDIIQFQRFHINQMLSKTNPSYESININKDTYIEEKNYWSILFNTDNWESLTNFWKYTCTYALGIKKSHFTEIGLFKKYYVSYGFEDTDLGYEAYKRNLKFKLVKTPLLHLTAYDQMQYKNSMRKRVKLLKVTAELFYLQHLKNDIYTLLGDYLRLQKPLKNYFKELFNS